MPSNYSQVTLQSLITQVLTLLDDENGVFYVPAEVTLAIQEALLYFGSLTAYWRTRQSFNVTPTATSPFYDLSTLFPQYRSRSKTVQSLVQEIQYHLLETPSGIAGTQASGQVPINTILNAVKRARNRFVIDAHLPDTVHPNYTSTPPPDGLVSFPQDSVFIHRIAWQDAGGQWQNLWRQDAWAFDKGQYQWTTEPGFPRAYSEAELAPLQIQIFPPPLNAGNLEAVTVDSEDVDVTDGASTLNIPDEWAHAVKFAALEDILTSGGQISDALRAQYCAMRYNQSIAFAKNARSVIRLMCNNVPLPIDAMTAIDAGYPFWRNQTGKPIVAGVLYDILAITPGLSDNVYSISVDLSQSAPIPVNLSDEIQIGRENLEDIVSYAVHYLSLKCGGDEFKATMSLYDGFMRSVSVRSGINTANIEYFEPLFGQWQREEGYKADQMAVKGGN